MKKQASVAYECCGVVQSKQASSLDVARRWRGEKVEEMLKFVKGEQMKGKKSGRDFAEFEASLHAKMLELERAVLAEVMTASDVDAEAIEIEGKTHRRVLQSKQTYMTSAGEVVVDRWLYKDRSREALERGVHSIAPLDLQLGIVESFWTPAAAKQAAWVVTQLTPQKASELFERVGNMTPSKTSLDRLPKAISHNWEQQRPEFEQVLRDAIVVPDGTRTLAVCLDGVMAPIDGGKRPTAVRSEAKAQGFTSQGPAGYREMSCATLGFCDAEGTLIKAIRFGRQPEAKKASLKATLCADLSKILESHPNLRLAKIADSGGDNWEFLESLPAGPNILDFYHATEHLGFIIAAVFGDSAKMEARNQFDMWRTTLLSQENGVRTVIAAVARLRRQHPHKLRVARELRYLRNNKHRMQYAKWRSEGYPIGSGVVEAACKTLVTQRLKLSGMRWSALGAQAIVTMRGWDQSERFDEAWALVASTYECEVHILANVVSFSESRVKRASRGSE